MWVRFDNLLKTPWLNLKFGRFEMDTLISEARTLTLSGNGGFYQSYHYLPAGDSNFFGGFGKLFLLQQLVGMSCVTRANSIHHGLYWLYVNEWTA